MFPLKDKTKMTSSFVTIMAQEFLKCASAQVPFKDKTPKFDTLAYTVNSYCNIFYKNLFKFAHRPLYYNIVLR